MNAFSITNKTPIKDLATTTDIRWAIGKALISQGMGPDFSRKLENRITALKRKLAKVSMRE